MGELVTQQELVVFQLCNLAFERSHDFWIRSLDHAFDKRILLLIQLFVLASNFDLRLLGLITPLIPSVFQHRHSNIEDVFAWRHRTENTFKPTINLFRADAFAIL
ncbi:hypothetical protein [Aliiroseovarius crassostreae]|uniref:hypothetical protein n=1 Tax=Aliiroseovarius crassostreae TaxID=154981 RepID=UPI0007A73D2C|nr:hypothetical protein [Aliiroseovarius crassostreae]